MFLMLFFLDMHLKRHFSPKESYHVLYRIIQQAKEHLAKADEGDLFG